MSVRPNLRSLAAALVLAAAPVAAAAPGVLRVATFNCSLNRNVAGGLIQSLATGTDAQARTVAEIIQRVRPAVLLLNEFDHDGAGVAAALFQRRYLSVSQNGALPIHYPHRFLARSNTGVPSGFDLNNNGQIGGPDDAFGFGAFPGQFGMVIYSRFPILAAETRTFQTFLWQDMPGALLPDNLQTPQPADWYSPAELAAFRLSSKSHWDVVLDVQGDRLHVLASHPTPPVFDGPEDRNGKRNHDEIRFFADYVDPAASGYIYDDQGRHGGLAPNARFVVLGDLNADPFDGDGVNGAALQLLASPFVNALPAPASLGGRQQALLQGGANQFHQGDPAEDTADFADGSSGNLRADYVLPSRNLQVVDSGVFWPLQSDPLFPLVGTFPFPASDHRLIWVDLLWYH